MADTILSPTGLVQIEVGASDNTWGAKENTDKATINGWFDTGPVLKLANGGTGAASAAAARTALSLVVGTNVQAWDADLDAIAALATATFGRSVLTQGDAAGTRSLIGAAANAGVTDASNASAGIVGEYISSNVAQGSSVSLTSGVGANITSISLTAGDWDVSGNGLTNPGASTQTQQLIVAISLVSAVPSGGVGYATVYPAAVGGAVTALATGVARISVSSTTTVYLVFNQQFTISTLGGFGFVGARRVR